MKAPPLEYGTIVVVGGGCYGSYYVRQLGRAFNAGALTWKRVLVVDRDPACKVLSEPELSLDAPLPGVEVVVQDWTAFFQDYLSRWETVGGDTLDAIVPSPLMPHLLYDWVRHRAEERWPHRRVSTEPVAGPVGTPWERAGEDGTHYVSFADWMCPINCIEPDLCPHTRGPRSWTMPEAVKSFVESRRAAGETVLGPLVFHCTHRAYGVGMIDTAAVIAADHAVQTTAVDAPAMFLIGTVSHCHGALSLLAIS